MTKTKSFINIDTSKLIEFNEENIVKVNEPDAAGVFGVFLKDGNCIMCKNVPDGDPESLDNETPEGDESTGAPPEGGAAPSPEAPEGGLIRNSEGDALPSPEDIDPKNPMLSDIDSVDKMGEGRVRVFLKSGDAITIPDARLA